MELNANDRADRDFAAAKGRRAAIGEPVISGADLANAIASAQMRVAEQMRASTQPKLGERVRCKVRIKNQAGSTFVFRRWVDAEGNIRQGFEDVTIKFGREDVTDPNDAGKPFKYGDVVYLTRAAYERYAGEDAVTLAE